MIIGTAGHIDHGKTALVKALTGIDTDRLKEEKRRGITLELGFAHLALPGGQVAGVVDVPGHERFVKAMAAGAGGVDLAILVVALDEGAMPQTREHLDICRLLGVRAGVVAVTKSDLLPELGAEWLDLLKADLQALTEGTFLEGAPVVPCSARTGEGLDALKSVLSEAARGAAPRPAEGPAFLPVDRAFTMKGFGTVVTGTLLSGQLSPEDTVSLLPGAPGPLRIRGVQIHGRAVPKALAGQRVAVNLADVDAAAVSRGMVLARSGELPETRMLDVEVSLLPAVETPLKKRQKLLLHLGTAQVEATLALLDAGALAPGETALAQLRLAEKVVALPDQRFILRGSRALPGRGATLAGGRVLNISAARGRRGAAARLAPLLDGDPEARVAWLLDQAGWPGRTERELAARSGLPPRAVQRALEVLPARGRATLVDRERRLWLSTPALEAIKGRVLSLLSDFHAREPGRPGLPKEELRQRLAQSLDPRIFARALALATADGELELMGDVVRLPGRGRAFSEGEAAKSSRMAQLLSEARLAPPRRVELAEALALPEARVSELLAALAAEGRVTKVTDELYFDRAALEGLKERLVSHLRSHGEITTQAFKEMVGQSRKFVIPLSEHFDRERVTLRVGEKRVLRRG